MKCLKGTSLVALSLSVLGLAASRPVSAQEKKPNIVFIMGDDIGWMQPHIYHRGLMVGETPRIDRIGNEGAIFMTYQDPESYNLTQVIEQVRKLHSASHGGEQLQ